MRFWAQLIELINAIHYIKSKKFWTLIVLLAISITGASAKPQPRKLQYLKNEVQALINLSDYIEDEALKSIMRDHIENITILVETGRIPQAQIADTDVTDDIRIYIPRD